MTIEMNNIWARRSVASAPTAVSDRAFTNAATPVTVSVLDNDFDADNAGLTVTAVTTPTCGTTTVNAATTITFTPNAGFFGDCPFSYTVSDGTLTSTGRVVVTVSPGETAQSPGQTTLCAGA